MKKKVLEILREVTDTKKLLIGVKTRVTIQLLLNVFQRLSTTTGKKIKFVSYVSYVSCGYYKYVLTR